ncbi:MAG TPA: hypothetical protein ENK18_19550 [Deltaproteobacteria bacterium]|nr:hypothetical protein [Deltaproteobacteria bacterium]
MLLESLLVISGLVVTVTLGAPLAASLARVHEFRRTVNPNLDSERERPVHNAAFVPLDLGPDLVPWPSQRPSSERTFRSQDWPSQAWDDTHFGSHWRDGRVIEVDDLGFHAMSGRRYDDSIDESEAVQHNEVVSRRRREQAIERHTQQQRSRPGAQPKQADKPRRAPPRAAARRNDPPERQVERVEQPRAALARQPPSRAEIEAMIVDVGLAGTVQAIMERTGWDFRKAAHYLAQIRQGT